MSNPDMMKVNRVQGQDTSAVSPVSYYAATATSGVDSLSPILQNVSKRIAKSRPEKKPMEYSDGDSRIMAMNDHVGLENYNYFMVSNNLIIQP